MAIRLPDGRFQCSICNKIHAKEIDAERCKISHEVLYIPMTRTELNRLIQALYLGKPELVPESLYETFRKFQIKAVTDGS